MTTIRSFIAIELSDQACQALTDLQNRLKRVVPRHTVRWTAPQNIHLTLHFLGAINPAQVKLIGEVLQTAVLSQPFFSLTLAGLGCFPNIRRPRIIWAGISGETVPLLALQAELGSRLQQAINFKPDSRPYSPHLTLGRVKQELPSRQLTQLGQVLNEERAGVGELASLSVGHLSLMQSELKPTGAVYTQLVEARLSSA